MRTSQSPQSHSTRVEQLDEEEVHQMAAEVLLEHLPLRGKGKKSSPEKVVDVLLGAAANRSSIEQLSAEYEGVPSPNTVRNTLKQCLTLESAEDALNAALLEPLEPRYWKKELDVAVDLHQEAYYGTPEQEDHLCAGEHKAGTNHFHTYATVYVMRSGRRMTLALVFVRKGQKMVSVLRALKKRLDAAGLRTRLWLADKGFGNVEVLRWLRRHVPLAYVPLAVNGRKDPPSATRALASLQRSCFMPYTMSNRNHSIKLRLTVAVVHHKAEPSRSGELKKPRTLLYALVGTRLRRHLRHLRPSAVSRTYSRRFGIESSYRQLHQACARTSSRSAMLRLLYVGIALLLRNLWVLCCWMLSAHPGPGARRKHSDFTFELLLNWIRLHLIHHLQFRTMRPLQAPSPRRF